MADTLKVYKGSEVVGSAVRGVDGKAVVTINGLEADTNYASGDYKVSFSNEGGESAKVNVPAFKTKPINVTGVTLNKASTTLDTGATETLTSTVAPSTASNKSVTYSSSNTGVATVDNNGKITAVAVGTSDITVKTVDGNKTAKCTVTVNQAVIAVTGVTIAPKTASIDVGATTQLSSTVAPSTASNKAVTYSSSDSAIATVSNDGTVTGVAEGTANITVTTTDGSKTDVSAITVNAVVEPDPEV